VAEIAPVAREGSEPVATAPGLHGSKGLGLEIANIAALPDSEDYAQDAFYRANFTPSEIAHCSKQPVARTAFQGIFALKRAIVKSGAASEPKEGYKDIEIGFDGEGRAVFPGCLLSLSDTGTIAAAACFWPGGLEWPSAQTATAPQAAPAQPKIIPARIRILAAFVALSLMALFGLGILEIFRIARW